MTNKIELSSRRNIIDSFIVTKITWYGNEQQDSFLSRIFDLHSLPSNDYRYKTAAEDIYKHTVMNFDWPDEWIFTDKRFNILNTSDSLFLDFLCTTLHPAVRDNQEQIITLIEIYNNNLKKYNYEIYRSSDIAGKAVYSSRKIETKPIPTHINNETKLALVIGCSDYLNSGSLANPVNDANGMESKLKSLGFEVIKVLNPSQKQLKVAIDEFGLKLYNFSTGLFFFAGHGVQVKGLNYLIPVDADLKTERMVEYDCVEANRVLSLMEDSKTRVNIIILDACRDNPFERSWGRGIGLRGLTTMNAPHGSLIAYSTSPGKTASDGLGSNGLYTEMLLNHIASKSLTITSMFINIRNDVMAKSKNEQVPWESTSLTADYFFNP